MDQVTQTTTERKERKARKPKREPSKFLRACQKLGFVAKGKVSTLPRKGTAEYEQVQQEMKNM